jgi:protein involved in polysaccharide export with SLBB domain
MKVSLWGAVRIPGYYIIPSYTNVHDLISYAGGPIETSKIEDIRIIRMNQDSTLTMIKCDMSDYYNDNDITKIKRPDLLKPGDTVIIPATAPKLFFRDYLTYGATFLSILASIVLIFIYYK